MAQKYIVPDIPAQELRPRVVAHEQELTHETIVVVVHRGGPTIKDLWDSQEWVIPPGVHKMPYGIARHFQKRAIVPGTRNPNPEFGGKAISQLAVVGIDKEENCRPFTEEQLRQFEFKEGLDRSLYASLAKRSVDIVPTNDRLAQVLSGQVEGADDEEVMDGDTGEALADQVGTGASTAGLRPEPKGKRR